MCKSEEFFSKISRVDLLLMLTEAEESNKTDTLDKIRAELRRRS